MTTTTYRLLSVILFATGFFCLFVALRDANRFYGAAFSVTMTLASYFEAMIQLKKRPDLKKRMKYGIILWIFGIGILPLMMIFAENIPLWVWKVIVTIINGLLIFFIAKRLRITEAVKRETRLLYYFAIAVLLIFTIFVALLL